MNKLQKNKIIKTLEFDISKGYKLNVKQQKFIEKIKNKLSQNNRLEDRDLINITKSQNIIDEYIHKEKLFVKLLVQYVKYFISEDEFRYQLKHHQLHNFHDIVNFNFQLTPELERLKYFEFINTFYKNKVTSKNMNKILSKMKSQINISKKGISSPKIKKVNSLSNLSLKNFNKVDIEAKGYCMFLAVYTSLHFIEKGELLKKNSKRLKKMQSLLREKTIKYLKSHKNKYSPFIETNENINSYIERMSKPYQWGGNIELHIISRILKRDIIIFKPNGHKYTISYQGSNKKPQSIYLYHSGQVHYESLIPKN